ncbi:unnamed protein product [Colias eurytheme]|nr:unnamed protein product [Colias eurytheme]
MALAMVCGYDEKRDNGWLLDRSQASPYVTKPWLRENTGVGVGLTLDGESNYKTDNAWLALPARHNKDKHVGPWLALETEASHKAPWLAPHEARTASRGKRQIVMECCLKACSEDELLSYC